MKRSQLGIIGLIITLFLVACESVTFKNPQPVDVPNQYLFPEEFHGLWIEESSSGTADSILINSNSFLTIIHDRIVLSKDSVRSEGYRIEGNRIYLKKDEKDGDWGQPFLYIDLGDSIQIEKVGHDTLELGPDMFVRFTGRECIVNFKQDNGLFDIAFLSIKSNGELLVLSPSVPFFKEWYEESIVESEDLGKYYNLNLSSKDIQNVIDQGGFSDTLLHLKNRVSK